MNILLHPRTERAIQAFVSQPSHALLLVGPQGAGKKTIASDIAFSLLGGHNKHNITLVSPNEKGITTIDTIRQLHSELSKTNPGQQTVRHVVIIESADSMPPAAANALLKSLEEPSSGTLFILLSPRLSAVPATIASRCQIIRVHKPERERVLAALEKQGLSQSDAQLSYARNEGLPGALQISGTEQGARDPLLTTLKDLLTKNAYSRLIVINELSRDYQFAEIIDGLEKIAHAGLLAAIRQTKTSLIKRWVVFLDKLETLQNQQGTAIQTKLALTDLFLSL